MKKSGLLLSSLLLILTISFPVFAEESSNLSDSMNTESSASATDENKSKDEWAEIIALFAKSAKSINEFYITEGTVTVGTEEEELKPGLYDIEILSGNGYVRAKRNLNLKALHGSWNVAAPGSNKTTPSKVRLILEKTDQLEFNNISKVKFTAVPEKVEQTNELSIGEFFVNRDIKAGKYKLSTNLNLNPSFKTLGWEIEVYDVKTNKRYSQKLNPENNDLVLNLKSNQTITIKLHNTDTNTNADDARLIFTPVN